MKRKKQGATLIVGVIIFAFITTVMIAMLSMVAGNYKARVVESKRVENLYGAESGLDVAYNIIGQTFNAAVKYGNLQVDNLINGDEDISNPNSVKYTNLINDIDYWKNCSKAQTATSDDKKTYRMNIMEDNENIELLKNEEFKLSFNEFLYKENSNNLDNTRDSDNIDELAKSIIDKKYIIDFTKSENNGRRKDVIFNENNGEQDPILLVYDDKNPTKSVDDPTKPIEANKDKSGIYYIRGAKNANKSRGYSESERKLEGDYKLIIDVYDKQEYIVKVTSNFETVSANGPNPRSVQATYTIKVPDYGQSLKKYELFDNKSLIVGKNMTINNANNITVNGDIFVQGEADGGTGEIAYDKYLGGIKIDESKNINFNYDVITRSTFNIIDDVDVNINQSLYARNIYAGNGKDFANKSVNDKSTLDIANDLVVDNDLTLKAKNTDITIGNFYGINDKTVKSDSSEAKERNSSCIIVNGNDNSKVEIKDDGNAYIMGVAYIDTKDITGTQSQPYKTGESVAVKKNYIAYSVPDPSKPDEKFSYNNPLYLLDKDDSGDEVDQKSEHFENYWHDKSIDTGGIQLPENTWANGAIIYSGNVKNDTTKRIGSTIEENIIKPKRIAYASKVYKFGQTSTDGNDVDDYTNGEDGATGVSELMDLSKIDTVNDILNNQVENSEKAIFNKEDRKIIIQNTSGEKSIDIPNDPTSPITIETNGEILKAVIATNGEVTIKDNVTFEGSIITNKNLEIQGTGITISQNSDVVKSVQAQNLDLFEAVFKDGQYYKDAIDYDLSNYLDNKLWKLIK